MPGQLECDPRVPDERLHLNWIALLVLLEKKKQIEWEARRNYGFVRFLRGGCRRWSPSSGASLYNFFMLPSFPELQVLSLSLAIDENWNMAWAVLRRREISIAQNSLVLRALFGRNGAGVDDERVFSNSVPRLSMIHAECRRTFLWIHSIGEYCGTPFHRTSINFRTEIEGLLSNCGTGWNRIVSCSVNLIYHVLLLTGDQCVQKVCIRFEQLFRAFQIFFMSRLGRCR